LPVPLKPMRSMEDIEKGIVGFVKYLENMCNVNIIREYRRHFEHMVYYWCNMKDVLHEPLIASLVLKDRFWPTTHIQVTQVD